MRLVGASCFYIQAPFIMEAAFAGLIGGTTVRRTHRVHARHRRSSGFRVNPSPTRHPRLPFQQENRLRNPEGVLLAQLVRQQRVNAHVEYHSFALQESHDGDLPVPFPDDYEQDVFLNGFPGRLDFYSGGHTHTATVIVEVWDGPPPAQEASAWDEQGEAEFESASGEVAVWSGSVGRTETFALGSPGPWHVRAYCVGRAEAAALSEGEGTGHDVERYLVQFWPAT